MGYLGSFLKLAIKHSHGPIEFLTVLFLLGLVVVIHEFGHLIVALKLGVRVERFTVGFGPELFWLDLGPEYPLLRVCGAVGRNGKTGG